MKFPWTPKQPVPPPGPTSDLQLWLDAAVAELERRGENEAARIRQMADEAGMWLKANIAIRDAAVDSDPPVFYVAVPFKSDYPWQAPWMLNYNSNPMHLFPDAVRVPDEKLPAGEFTIIVAVIRKEKP